jgi:hypothetical protein
MMQLILKSVELRHRRGAMECADLYERKYMSDGRGIGKRNCVVFSAKPSDPVFIGYHTKTAVVIECTSAGQGA